MILNSRQVKSFKALLTQEDFPRFQKQIKRCDLLEHDSRQVDSRSAFVNWVGEQNSGLDFIHEIKKKSPCIFLDKKDRLISSSFNKANKNFFYIKDLKKNLTHLTLAFYNWPSEKLKVVGITGTNGKTTIAYLLEKFYKTLKFKTGVIGTINYRFGKKTFPSINTTPHLVDLQKIFFLMLRKKVQVVFLEISSQGLYHGRAEGIELDQVLWTNLTPEHLDFHRTLSHYFNSKFEIIKILERSKKKNKRAFFSETTLLPLGLKKKLLPYTSFKKVFLNSPNSNLNSFTPPAIYANISSSEKSNFYTLFHKGQTWTTPTSLIGDFNSENISLSLLEVFYSEKDSSGSLYSKKQLDFLDKFKKDLKKIVIPGRLEQVPHKKGLVFVDYAHSPDALKNILKTLKTFTKKEIICIFGCGGDRDKVKRAPMGVTALTYADEIIITSDNPRTENPQKIINDIEKGILKEVSKFPHKKYFKIISRKNAIKKGVNLLNKKKLLLIAGKGHENYQLINGEIYSFSDKAVVKEFY